MAKRQLENRAAERSVIGTLLQDEDAFWAHKDRLRPELFALPLHQRIMKAMHKLVEDGRDINMPAVLQRLPEPEREDGTDPAGYLAMLMSDDADPGSLKDFISDLEQLHAGRKMMQIGQLAIKWATEDTEMDATSRLERVKDEINKVDELMQTSTVHIADVAAELFDRVNHAYQHEAVLGTPYGIKPLDEIAGNLQAGRLILLAGAPGAGKTSLAMQIAMNVSQDKVVDGERIPGKIVQFETQEMQPDEIASREMSVATGIPSNRINSAQLNNEEMISLLTATRSALKDHRIYMNKRLGTTVPQIAARAVRRKRETGLDVLIVDNLLRLQKPSQKMDEFQALRRNLELLNELADDLGIAVVLLTQFKAEYTRLPWKMIREPNVSDLYGGGAPEQEADVVVMIYREDAFLKARRPRKDDPDHGLWEQRYAEAKGEALLINGKNRGAVPFRRRIAYFDTKTLRFLEQPPRPAADDQRNFGLDLDD